jgi:nucleotide-binding universal stress UspA family protein
MSTSWNTIVVGYDDTESAKRALARAADLASSREVKLIVTSVAPVLPPAVTARGLGPTDPVDPPEIHRAELEQARDFLRKRGIDAEFDLEIGEPAATIVKVADKHQADAIVVGTREPGLADRLMRGSVSQGVSKQAHCDVVIVH